MDKQCTNMADMDQALTKARAAVDASAAALWPGWNVASTPVVMIDAEGRRWLYRFRHTRSQRSIAGLSTCADVYYIGRVRPRPLPFRAAAKRENGQVRLEIVAPALAPLSYESWESIFAHEAFHCYQLNHRGWLRWFRKAREGSPSLQRLDRLYRFRSWLRLDIDDQLRMVRSILSSRQFSPAALKQLQESRRQHIKRLHRLSWRLSEAEQAAEIVEGAARFVEFGFERLSGKKKRKAAVIRRGRVVADADRGLSVADGRYYYATGYGLMRLLDLSGQPWRERILKKGIDFVLDDLVARVGRI